MGFSGRQHGEVNAIESSFITYSFQEDEPHLTGTVLEASELGL